MVLQNPKIWLLDEPTASLDGEVEARITDLIRGLPKDTTVIFSTHRRGWVALSERVLHLDEGQIKSDTPSSKLLGPSSKATVTVSKPNVKVIEGVQ